MGQPEPAAQCAGQHARGRHARTAAAGAAWGAGAAVVSLGQAGEEGADGVGGGTQPLLVVLDQLRTMGGTGGGRAVEQNGLCYVCIGTHARGVLLGPALPALSGLARLAAGGESAAPPQLEPNPA